MFFFVSIPVCARPCACLAILTMVMVVKCTLVQALSLCTVRRPTGGVEVYLYSFLTTALEGVRGKHHAPAALNPRERPSAGLDRCRISGPYRDSTPGPSSP